MPSGSAAREVTEAPAQGPEGDQIHDWPLVVAKELLDNSLDAAEEAEVAPDITVIVEADRIIVRDNAGGIATQRPSSPSSTTRSGSAAAKPTSARPAAPRATP
jgi:hypothetical protein